MTRLNVSSYQMQVFHVVHCSSKDESQLICFDSVSQEMKKY